MCAVGVALECDKGTVPLSHAGKACLAQGFVEDDGGAVGEVECADAVVVRIDEVAADILPKDGLMAVLDMPSDTSWASQVSALSSESQSRSIGMRSQRSGAAASSGSGMPELSLPKTKKSPSR